jgi:hypothetical protein
LVEYEFSNESSPRNPENFGGSLLVLQILVYGSTERHLAQTK